MCTPVQILLESSLTRRNFLNRLFTPHVLGSTCVWLIVLVVFAFPITSSMPVLLKVNSTPINLALKFCYLLLSGFLLFGALLRKESRYLNWGCILILLFWIIYSGRLFYDTLFVGLKFARMSYFKFYSIAFGLVLSSTLAVIFTGRYVKWEQAAKYFFFSLLLSNITIILVLYKIYGTLNPVLIAARAMFLVELDGGDEISVLNPITLSYYGEVLALFSLALLFLKKNSFLRVFLYLLTCTIGIYVMIMGASRGPFLTFVILSVVLLFTNIKYSKKTSPYFVRITSILSLFIFFFTYWLIPKLLSLDIIIIDRIIGLFESTGGKSLEVRDYQWSAAWNQFIQNPIIGDQFLENYANYYPHNIYLESLMATGLIGGSIFFALVVYVLIKMVVQYYNKDILIIFSLLLLTAMLGNFTSGSLFASSRFWILLAFCLTIKKEPSKDLIICNKNINLPTS